MKHLFLAGAQITEYGYGVINNFKMIMYNFVNIILFL